MDEKTFELMEKFYADFLETKEDIKGIKQDVGILKVGQKKLEINMENEISNKVKMLFEGQKGINEHLEKIENKLDEVSEKVDKHDIKIQVIEGGKRKKTL